MGVLIRIKGVIPCVSVRLKPTTDGEIGVRDDDNVLE